jgi:hypothetical protein
MSQLVLPGEWVPWLIASDEVTKIRRLDLGKRFMNRGEITEFFTHMHKTHPHLVGQRISFEEEPRP